MNLAQRFTLLVKSSATRVMHQVEDPEASLTQLLAEMGHQLHNAKRATAQAIANERRLRAQADAQHEAADRWTRSARAALARGDEDGAREALRRAEQARRHGDELARQLAEQEDDTARIRKTVGRLKSRVTRSKARLQLLQSRMRQTEARRACSTVLRGVESADLYGEFERLGEKVELAAASEEAYLGIDDDLSGDALRTRLEEAEVDDAVEEQLAALRGELSGDPPASDPDAEAPIEAEIEASVEAEIEAESEASVEVEIEAEIDEDEPSAEAGDRTEA